MKINPKDRNAWNNKGFSLNELGRYEEAIKSLDHALRIDPKYAYAWNNKGISLNRLGRYEEAIKWYDKDLEINPEDAYARFNRSEALFAFSRWEEGFESIQDAFTLPPDKLEFLGDVESMFALIFHLSDEEAKLIVRVAKLVEIYEEAAKAHKPGDGENQSGNKPPQDPLAWLGDGLVKSLGKIDTDGLDPTVLQSYVSAVEQRMADIPQCEVPLRLFRYGIRYLISKDPAELVELVKPEREILYQALNLSAESD